MMVACIIRVAFAAAAAAAALAALAEPLDVLAAGAAAAARGGIGLVQVRGEGGEEAAQGELRGRAPFLTQAAAVARARAQLQAVLHLRSRAPARVSRRAPEPATRATARAEKRAARGLRGLQTRQAR